MCLMSGYLLLGRVFSDPPRVKLILAQSKSILLQGRSIGAFMSSKKGSVYCISRSRWAIFQLTRVHDNVRAA